MFKSKNNTAFLLLLVISFLFISCSSSQRGVELPSWNIMDLIPEQADSGILFIIKNRKTDNYEPIFNSLNNLIKNYVGINDELKIDRDINALMLTHFYSSGKEYNLLSAKFNHQRDILKSFLNKSSQKELPWINQNNCEFTKAKKGFFILSGKDQLSILTSVDPEMEITQNDLREYLKQLPVKNTNIRTTFTKLLNQQQDGFKPILVGTVSSNVKGFSNPVNAEIQLWTIDNIIFNADLSFATSDESEQFITLFNLFKGFASISKLGGSSAILPPEAKLPPEIEPYIDVILSTEVTKGDSNKILLNINYPAQKGVKLFVDLLEQKVNNLSVTN